MVQVLKGDGKAIFVVFIGAIIAIVFLASIGDSIFTQTNTASQDNLTVTVAAINVSLAVEGRDLITAIEVSNFTAINLEELGLNLTDGLVNGIKTVILRANDTASIFVGKEVNLTYTYNPDGYISSAGGRTISLLIIIFASLAILIFVLVVFIKNGTLGEFMRKK